MVFIVMYITLQWPLQYTICGGYLWHMLHSNDDYNVQYVAFIVAYITLQQPLQCTICDVYCGVYYITMYNMWCLLCHVLHNNDHYNGQYVMFIVACITLQRPLQCTICDVYCGMYYITTTITMDNMWCLLWYVLHYNDHYNGQYVMFIVACITLQWPFDFTYNV